MGCDIHVFTEYRDENGDWVSDLKVKYHKSDAGDIDDYTAEGKYPGIQASNRNYNLFGLLSPDCGRGDWCPEEIALETKGLPDDLSEEIERFYNNFWVTDSHSASYLEYKEIRALLTKLIIQSKYSEYFTDLHNFYKALPEVENTEIERRVIFWFDC